MVPPPTGASTSTGMTACVPLPVTHDLIDRACISLPISKVMALRAMADAREYEMMDTYITTVVYSAPDVELSVVVV